MSDTQPNVESDQIMSTEPTNFNERLDENMTNYNERLDEVLWSAIMHEPAPTKPGEEYKATWNEPVIKKAKQAITSLIKELVAEAKPPYKTDTRGATQNPDNAFYHTKKAQGYNEAIDQFEQNLLKALEEV